MPRPDTPQTRHASRSGWSAAGGIHELVPARGERGAAARLTEDADVAAAVPVGLLERRS